MSDSVARSVTRKRSICILMLLKRAGRRPRNRRRSRSSVLNAVPLLKNGLCRMSGPRTPISMGVIKSRRQPSHSQPSWVCSSSTESHGASLSSARLGVELKETSCEPCQGVDVFSPVVLEDDDKNPWIRCRYVKRRRDAMDRYIVAIIVIHSETF